MGFKSASRFQQFMSRSGSHGTTHSRRGDTSDISDHPDTSYSDESIVESIHGPTSLPIRLDRLVAAKGEILLKVRRLEAQSEKLPGKRNKDARRLVTDKIATLTQQLARLESKIQEIRSLTRKALDTSEQPRTFERMFVVVAQQALPPALFDELVEMCRKTLTTIAETQAAASYEKPSTQAHANAALAKMARSL